MGKLLIGIAAGAAVGAAAVYFLLRWPLPSRGFGRFTGDVTATFLEDGRLMRLEKDFAYVDPDEKLWLAPATSVIDGASIPQALWSLVGGPFSGQFRNASVVHDVACEERKETSDDVHRMFYFACRCGGVSEAKAKAMYYAVARFGPQWRMVHEVRGEGAKARKVGRPVDIVERAQLSEQEAKAILRYFEEHDPPLDEIPKLDVAPQS